MFWPGLISLVCGCGQAVLVLRQPWRAWALFLGWFLICRFVKWRAAVIRACHLYCARCISGDRWYAAVLGQAARFGAGAWSASLGRGPVGVRVLSAERGRLVTWQASGSLCRGDAAWAWCAYGGQAVSALVAGECVGWQTTVVVQRAATCSGSTPTAATSAARGSAREVRSPAAAAARTRMFSLRSTSSDQTTEVWCRRCWCGNSRSRASCCADSRCLAYRRGGSAGPTGMNPALSRTSDARGVSFRSRCRRCVRGRRRTSWRAV